MIVLPLPSGWDYRARDNVLSVSTGAGTPPITFSRSGSRAPFLLLGHLLEARVQARPRPSKLMLSGAWVDAFLRVLPDALLEDGEEGPKLTIPDQAPADARIAVETGAGFVDLCFRLKDNESPQIEMFGGLADFGVASSGARLRLGHAGGEAVGSLLIDPPEGGGSAALTMGIDLVALVKETTGVNLPAPHADELGEFELQVPLSLGPVAEGVQLTFPTRLLEWSFELPAQTRLFQFQLSTGDVGIDWTALQGRAAKAKQRVAQLLDLGGSLFDDLGATLPIPELDTSETQITVSDEGLRVSGLALRFEGEDLEWNLSGGVVELDDKLRARADAGVLAVRMTASETTSMLAEPKHPFTVVFHKDVDYELRFDGAAPELSAVPPAGAPVATVFVPGISPGAVMAIGASGDPYFEENDEIRKRFVLDVAASSSTEIEKPAVRFGPGGAYFRAEARARQVGIKPLRKATTVGGWVSVRGKSWNLEIDGKAELPWFEKSEGMIAVRGGNGPDGSTFGVTFGARLGLDWTDPSGLVTINETRVHVTIDWRNNAWDVDGEIGGKVTFNAAELKGHAKKWLNDLFDGNSIEFDGLSLKEVAKPSNLSLKLGLKRPLTIKLWEVFRYEIDEIKLLDRGFSFGGDATLALGPVRFGGRLPNIVTTLDSDGVSIELEKSEHLRIEGHLEMPSGISATMVFGVRRKPEEELLFGRGSITTPTAPGIDVLVIIGRFRSRSGGWLPTMTLAAQMGGLAITVYPGVIIRTVGLGFGLYSGLVGVDEAAGGSMEDVLAVLSGDRGAMPNPMRMDSWRRTEDTLVSLVARTYVTPTSNSTSEMDFYVADLIASLDSSLRVAAFTKLWLYTSLKDAMTREFEERPAARGIVVLDVKEPSLLAAFQTVKNPKSTLAKEAGAAGSPIIGMATGAIETRATLEARPNTFALILGPLTAEAKFGPLESRAEGVLGIRASRRGALALGHLAFTASFQQKLEGRFGPASFGVHVAAGVDFRATVLGGIADNALAIYGSMQVRVFLELGVYLKVEFRIRIKAGFVKITITFSKEWRLHVALHLNLQVQAVLSSGGTAVRFTAPVRFRVLGHRFDKKLDFEKGGPEGLIDRWSEKAREQLALIPGYDAR